MLTRDPNRLIVIIRDNEVTLRRLKKALDDSKQDNQGDAFIINRFVKKQEAWIKTLHEDWAELVKEKKELDRIRQLQYAKIEQAEVDALRSSLRLYDLEDRRL